MKVIDASVLVEFLADGEHHEAAELAITSSQDAAEKALAYLARVQLQRVSHAALVDRAWQPRENVTRARARAPARLARPRHRGSRRPAPSRGGSRA